MVGSIQGTRVYKNESTDHHMVVSSVNLKLRFQKSNYPPRGYDVGRLQDEILRETLQKKLNTFFSGEFKN